MVGFGQMMKSTENTAQELQEIFGMRYERTIKIPKVLVQELQEILDREEAVEDVKSIYIFETFTAKFDEGIEVDIKVCNGNPPFIDAVMFLNGCEVCVEEPGDSLLGESYFEFNGREYIVKVVEE